MSAPNTVAPKRPVWRRLPFLLGIGILLSGGVVSYAFATGELSAIFPSGPGQQPAILLVLDNYTISYDQNQQNPTVATLWLSNLGTTTTRITSIVIRDTSDNGSVLDTFGVNQTIGPHGASARVVVDSLSSGFYFTHGRQYYFTVKDVTGSQLGFHVSY
jgi:hypothetical protein